MTLRTRRLLIGTAIVVILLFAGRWGSEFLVERWWAATISPSAVAAVTRWRLLGLLLDGTAIAIASLWLILQAFTIMRMVKSVQIPRRIGNLVLLESVSSRLIVTGSIAVSVVLGWVAGVGASAWRGPVALAWQGVTWGVKDPLLGEDLGHFVARLPVWALLLDYLLTLLLLGLAFSAALYIGIGAIRRVERRLEIHPMARQHLGVLLVAVAAALMTGYLMTPWLLAASADGGSSLEGANRQILAHTMLAGLSLYVVVVSWLWRRSEESGRLALGWGILAGAHLVVLLISRPAPLTAAEEANRRSFTDLAWGIPADNPADTGTSNARPVPAIWDERLLEFTERAAGRRFLAATPVGNLGDSARTPGWIVASGDSAMREMRIRLIAEGIVTPEGTPRDLNAAATTTRPARALPGARGWDTVATGVRVTNFFSRLAVAWGRQVAGVLGVRGAAQLDWHLDPVDRARALLPMAVWLPADILLDEGRPVWVVQGLIPLEDFPLSQRQRIQGADYAGMVPGFLALVDAESGAVRFHLDPAAAPVARAWAAFAPGLVRSSDSLPAAVRQHLPYSATWLALQMGARALDGQTSGIGPTAPALGTPAVWSRRGAGRQVLEGNGVASLMVRRNGIPSWRSDTTTRRFLDSDRRAQQQGTVQRLQDSIVAAGDTTLTAALRWEPLHGGTLTWRPLVALSPTTGPHLVAIPLERDGRLMVVRSPRLIAADTLSEAVAAADDRDRRLAEARRWLAQADSALRRGDLTAFGRYFEGLQRALGGPF